MWLPSWTRRRRQVYAQKLASERWEMSAEIAESVPSELGGPPSPRLRRTTFAIARLRRPANRSRERSERLAKVGGEGGIRTHVPLTRQDAFEAPPLRPLRYLSGRVLRCGAARRRPLHGVGPGGPTNESL